MKDELNKLEVKLDKLDEKLDTVNIHLAEYNGSLKLHMKRTTQIENELLPIKEHVHQLRGVSKFIALLATIASIIAIMYNINKG